MYHTLIVDIKTFFFDKKYYNKGHSLFDLSILLCLLLLKFEVERRIDFITRGVCDYWLRILFICCVWRLFIVEKINAKKS